MLRLSDAWAAHTVTTLMNVSVRSFNTPLERTPRRIWEMRSRDTKGSCSVAAEGGRYATLPNRRRMLMESLGDGLVAKDLIDNALVTDESKRVSLAQEMTHTILNSY